MRNRTVKCVQEYAQGPQILNLPGEKKFYGYFPLSISMFICACCSADNFYDFLFSSWMP